MTEQPCIQVEASPAFKRNLRKLAKKYCSIRSNLQPVIKRHRLQQW